MNSEPELYHDTISPADFSQRMNFLRQLGFNPDLVIQVKLEIKLHLSIQGLGDCRVSVHSIVMVTRFAHLQEMLPKPVKGSITYNGWAQFPEW